MTHWPAFDRLLPLMTEIRTLPDPPRDGFGDRKREFEIAFDPRRLPRKSGDADRDVLTRVAVWLRADFDLGKMHRFERCHIQVLPEAGAVRVISSDDVCRQCVELLARFQLAQRPDGAGRSTRR